MEDEDCSRKRGKKIGEGETEIGENKKKKEQKKGSGPK